MDDDDLPFTQIIPQDDLDESGVEDNEACQVATLKVLGDSKLGIPAMQFPVYRGENVIGRKMNCNICIPFGASLSKKHAVIEAEHNCTFVYDCGSSNKTKMNQMFLRPHARYELKNDSNIRFGNVRCKYTEIVSAEIEDSTSSLIDIATTSTTPVSTSTILAPETPNSQDRTENKPQNEHSFCIPESQPVVGDSPIAMVIPETPAVFTAPSTSGNTTSLKKLKCDSNQSSRPNNVEHKTSAIRFQIDSDSDTDDEESNKKMNDTNKSNNTKANELSINTTKSETDICFPETTRISIPAMNHEIASDSEEEESILQNKDSCVFPSEFFSLDARDGESEEKQHNFKQPQLPSTSSHNSNLLQVTSSSVSEEISMCDDNRDSCSQPSPSQVFSEIPHEDSLSVLETQPISSATENNVSTNYSDEDSLGMMPTQSLSSEHFEAEEPPDTLSVFPTQALFVNDDIAIRDTMEMLPTQALVVNDDIAIRDTMAMLPTQALVVNENIASRDTMEMLATQPLMVTEDSVDSLEMLSTQSFDGNLDFYNVPTQPVVPATMRDEGSTSPIINTRKINTSGSSDEVIKLDTRTEAKPSKFKPILTPKTFNADNKMSSSTPNKIQPVPFDGKLDQVSDQSENKTEHSIDIQISNNDIESQKSGSENPEQKPEILNLKTESNSDVPCTSTAIENHNSAIVEIKDNRITVETEVDATTEEEKLPLKIPEVNKFESNKTEFTDLQQTDIPNVSTVATPEELNVALDPATQSEIPCTSSSIAKNNVSNIEESENMKADFDKVSNSDIPGTSNADDNQNHSIAAVEDLAIDKPGCVNVPIKLDDSYDITDLILENSGLQDRSSNSDSSRDDVEASVGETMKEQQPIHDIQASVVAFQNNVDLSPDIPVSNLAAEPPCVDEILEDENACDVSTSVLEQSDIGNKSIDTSPNQDNEEKEATAPMLLEDEDACDVSTSVLEQSDIGNEPINTSLNQSNEEKEDTTVLPLDDADGHSHYASTSVLEKMDIGNESINTSPNQDNNDEAMAPLPEDGSDINAMGATDKEPNDKNIQQIKNILDNFISQLNDDESRISVSRSNVVEVAPSSNNNEEINSEVDTTGNQTTDLKLALSYTSADESSFLTNQPINKTDEEQLPVEKIHKNSVDTSVKTEVQSQVENENKHTCDSPLPTKKFYNKSTLPETNENDIPSTSKTPTTSVKEVEVNNKPVLDLNEDSNDHLSQNEIEDLIVSVAGQRKRKFIKKNSTTDSQESKIDSKDETLKNVSNPTTDQPLIEHEVLELSKDVINKICSTEQNEEKSCERKFENICGPSKTSQETQVKEIMTDPASLNASKHIVEIGPPLSSDKAQRSLNSTKNIASATPKLVLIKADLDTSASDSESKLSIQEMFESANIRLRRSCTKNLRRQHKPIMKQKFVESSRDGNISDHCTQQFTVISRRRKAKTKLSNSKNTDDLATQSFVSNDMGMEHDIGTIDEDVQATQAYVASACDMKEPEEPGCSANKITRKKRTKTNIKKAQPLTRKSRRNVAVGTNQPSTSGTNQPKIKKQKVMKENVNPENSGDEDTILSQTSTVYEYSAANSSATVKPSSKQNKAFKRTLQPVEVQDDFTTPATRMKRKMLNAAPKVIFTGMVDIAAEKAVKSLGGEIVTDFNLATHLVTDKMRRTVKFLCAVARGLTIANVHWLMKSEKAKKFLPASDFKINDYEYEDTCTPGQLFQGISFYLTPAVVPPKEQMSLIIKSAGGSISNRIPRTTGTDTVTNVVLATEKDLKKCSNAIRMNIPIVCNEFVLTGILRKEVDFGKHALFLEGSPQVNQIPQTSSALDETVSTTTAKRKLKSPPLTRKSSRLRSGKK